MCRKPQHDVTIKIIVARFYDPPASKLFAEDDQKY